MGGGGGGVVILQFMSFWSTCPSKTRTVICISMVSLPIVFNVTYLLGAFYMDRVCFWWYPRFWWWFRLFATLPGCLFFTSLSSSRTFTRPSRWTNLFSSISLFRQYIKRTSLKNHSHKIKNHSHKVKNHNASSVSTPFGWNWKKENTPEATIEVRR